MSWLLSKMTGGLLGGGGTTSTTNTETSREDDEEEQQEQQSSSDELSGTSSPSSVDSPQDYSSLSFGNLTEVCRADISFSVWNPPPQPMTPKSLHALLVIARESSGYQRYLHIYFSPDHPVLVQPITGALWRDVDPTHHQLLFGVMLNDKRLLFRVEFHNPEQEKQVSLEWSIAVWEHQQQDSFIKQIKDPRWVDPLEEKYKEVDEKQVQKKPEDDYDFMEVDLDESASSANDDEEEEEEEEAEVSARHSTPIRGFKSSAPARPRTLRASSGHKKGNDKLAVGMTINRTYVGRGSDLGVFKYDDSGDLQFLTQISNVKTKTGSVLAPTQMMLHDQDRKMVMLNADDPTRVFEMDIERGQIVSEYGTDRDGFAIRSVGPVTKYAENTPTPIIVGVNKNTVFSLDPRLPRDNKIAQEKSYTTAMGMSSVISTGGGDVAVGSDKGEIRLYNDISKIAKTRLPGTGDPIIGLDVTESGDWLLATTRYYLLLISTAAENEETGASINGWNKSLTAHAQPPIKLQLSPQHMQQYNVHDLSFTTAHFNTGENIREEWIVSSIGPYIITWNFRLIKLNPQKYRYEYKIKRCVEDVVAEQFRYGQQDQVVVTLPDNVYMEHKGSTSKKK